MKLFDKDTNDKRIADYIGITVEELNKIAKKNSNTDEKYIADLVLDVKAMSPEVKVKLRKKLKIDNKDFGKKIVNEKKETLVEFLDLEEEELFIIGVINSKCNDEYDAALDKRFNSYTKEQISEIFALMSKEDKKERLKQKDNMNNLNKISASQQIADFMGITIEELYILGKANATRKAKKQSAHDDEIKISIDAMSPETKARILAEITEDNATFLKDKKNN